MSDEQYDTKNIRDVGLNQCTDVAQIISTWKEVLESERRSLLDAVDRTERLLGISPRTAEIRRVYKQALLRVNKKHQE